MHICCRFSIILAILAASVSAFAASTLPSTRNSRTLPPAFETNVGQVKFSDGSSTAYVDAVIRVNGTMAYVHRAGLHLMQTSITPTEGSTKHEVEFDVAAFRVDMELIASNPSPRIEFQQKAPGIIRHILPGGGRDGFVADRYNAIVYHEVWPGIDLRMYVNSIGVKYDFIVHPGADAQQIAFRYV
ncbi:MAG TPA: hypothetical protein VK147_01715, partial [Candidatus Didemnitutus sp.]|nr:hypothetical protein [Candidatus Didemnitutus sp.]